MVWCERLKPSESRDFALGNVIAATTNVTSKLRPTSQCHPDDYEAPIFDDQGVESDEESSTVQTRHGTRGVRGQIQEFASAAKTLIDSIRAREGFFVCELTNHSDKPAYVFIQLNKSGYYGGSGLVGLLIKMISIFFRLPHLSAGR